jgi:GT2 family glycosyltransferase
VRAVVVIPTHNARDLLADALASLAAQTAPCTVVVVDNASSDGTPALVADRFPDVRLVAAEANLGFGRAVNLGVEQAAADADAIVLVNNDTVCEPDFVERLTAPLADPGVGMVAGVLLQASRPDLVDSAGIELDATLGSWDLMWNRPLLELDAAPRPIGPCGGAAAYRAVAFREAGGFDETFFAYWEDVELALRLRLAGWSCAFAREARALHRHGATLGAASPAQRRLEAFGRGYVLARYRVPQHGLLTRLRVAALDWPGLAVHLLARREAAPIRERARGLRAGYAKEPLRAPVELATVSVRRALGRHLALLRLRATGGLPEHFSEHGPGGTRG